MCAARTVTRPNSIQSSTSRLAVHKQSFLNLLKQNGRRVTKVYKDDDFKIVIQAKLFKHNLWRLKVKYQSINE